MENEILAKALEKASENIDCNSDIVEDAKQTLEYYLECKDELVLYLQTLNKLNDAYEKFEEYYKNVKYVPEGFMHFMDEIGDWLDDIDDYDREYETLILATDNDGYYIAIDAEGNLVFYSKGFVNKRYYVLIDANGNVSDDTEAWEYFLKTHIPS